MIKPRPPRLISTRLVPSAVTVLAMCLGLTAVKFALDQRPTESMALLAAAAILDADPRYRLDGVESIRSWLQARVGETTEALASAFDLPAGIRRVDCVVAEEIGRASCRERVCSTV